MSGFVGCTTMRPMCSLALSPMLFHVLPPSSERYTPSPQPTLRWLLFSPEPTHTVSGRDGASVTQPMLAVPCSSKIGVNDVPAFVVFHTPPYADATYHTVLSRGSTARSTTRPDVTAGPMERNLSPPNVEADSLPSGLAGVLNAGLSAGFAAGFAVGLVSAADTAVASEIASMNASSGRRFMSGGMAGLPGLG
jgi:hypothetical protein